MKPLTIAELEEFFASPDAITGEPNRGIMMPELKTKIAKKETYKVNAICSNCGHLEYSLEYPKGVPVGTIMTGRKEYECPNCGVDNYWRLMRSFNKLTPKCEAAKSKRTPV